MFKGRSFAFIVNPYAGRGRAQEVESNLFGHLRRSQLSYEIQKTSDRFHATTLARQAADQYDVVVAVGGDGTVHEVANGVVGTRSSFSVLPAGSGNDFARLLKVPRKMEDALDSLKVGMRRVFDVGRFKVDGLSTPMSGSKYFINSLGIGLDAAIAKKARDIRWLRGVPLYFAASLRTLLGYKAQEFTVAWDEQKRTGRMFLVCVGNGDREGGGFRVTPDAKPDDQVFQICIVDEMSVVRALGILPLAMQGKHGRSKGITMANAKRITVESVMPFVVHADGEIIGSEVKKVEIELQEGLLGVILPPA